jgi:hypothetical protein
MIQIGDTFYSFSDPLVVGLLIAAAITVLVLALLISSVRRAGKSGSRKRGPTNGAHGDGCAKPWRGPATACR